MQPENSQTVLVIDPEAPFRQIIQKALAPLGCRFLEASSYADGYDLALTNVPDLVILDVGVNTPDEALQVCHELLKGEKPIPTMVFLTSQLGDCQIRIQGFKAGAVDFLHKPFLMEELRARASLHLKLQEANKRESKRLRSLHERQKSEFIQTFALGIAHNFNNLLTAGLGFLHLARDGMEDRRTLGHLRNLELVQERMCELSRQLIMLAGDYDVAKRPVMVRKALFGALSMFDAAALKRRVTLVCEFGALKQTQVLADEFHLIQALLQILGNARESMDDNGGRIYLRGRLEERTVVIEIEDTGKGVPPEIMAHIKDPFYTSKQEVGVGLSLASVNRLIRDFGGDLLIENGREVGTVVQIRLPALEKEAPEIIGATAGFRPGVAVLLAVDSPETQRALQAVLLSEQILADVVQKPSELFASLSAPGAHYDAIVVDLLRNQRFGDDLVGDIRSRTALPLIYLYASREEAPNEQEGLAMLSKPFRPEDFLAVLLGFPQLRREEGGQKQDET